MSNVIYVAEIGSLHKGDKSLAYEMIRQFKDAGASAIKFQFGWTKEAQEKYGLTYNPIRFIDDWVPDLIQWRQYFNIDIFGSVWSDEGLKALEALEPDMYKIAYKVAGDYEFCDRIYDLAGYNTVYVSLDRHSPFVDYHKGVDGFNKFVWCKSKYPTYPWDLKVTKEYPGMPAKFSNDNIGDWYGYSDHMHGIAPCLLAVSRGAQYVEKHVCLDKSDMATKDTPFSATPSEFRQMVQLGNEISEALDAFNDIA